MLVIRCNRLDYVTGEWQTRRALHSLDEQSICATEVGRIAIRSPTQATLR